MNKTLALLAALALTFSVRADVIIYTKTTSTVTTGAGAVTREVLGGWLIWDPSNGHMLEIEVHAHAGWFSVIDFDFSDTLRVTYLSSGLNKQHLVLSFGYDYGVDRLSNPVFYNAVLKGRVRSLKPVATTWDLPVVMLGTGNRMFTNTDGFAVHRDYKFRLTYRAVLSKKYGALGMYTAVEALSDFLIARGYKDYPPF